MQVETGPEVYVVDVGVIAGAGMCMSNITKDMAKV